MEQLSGINQLKKLSAQGKNKVKMNLKPNELILLQRHCTYMLIVYKALLEDAP